MRLLAYFTVCLQSILIVTIKLLIGLIDLGILISTLLATQLTTVEQRKLIKLIESNIVRLHCLAALVANSVISYKRNC